LGLKASGKGKVAGSDDAVDGFKEGGFKDGGQLADVAGPVVLEETGERAGAEDYRALLVAGADAVEEGLGEGGDVFAAHAQRWDGEADRGETEGEVGHEEALAGHLAERGLRGGEDNGAAGGTVLECLEDAEKQTLAGRGEEVNAVEIGEAGKGGGVSIGNQPLAGVAALECGVGEGGTVEEITGQGLLAAAVLAFNGGNLDVGCGHFSLHKELAPGGANAYNLKGVGGIQLDQREAGDGG
jgi:hypothetical protein